MGTAAYLVQPRGPLCWLDPGAFGTLGVGAGFALGAKLCRLDAEVWCLFGDGAFGYSLIEFDTFVRHKVTGRAGLREAQSLGFWEISSGVDWGGSSLSGRGPVPASHLPLAKPWD